MDRHTFAYPTTLTDADSNSSVVQYNFDFGATTRTQSPAPANQSQGTIQTMAYNNLGQLERVTTVNNGAYKRFWYGPNYVARYSTVNTIADELYVVQAVDGLGRVVTELNANGQKLKTYVYLGEERLAEQGGGSVTGNHANPLTGSQGSSYASGLYVPEKELDPMLVDVGFQDPYVEGMSWDCMSAYRLVDLGHADEMVPTTVYAVYGSGTTKAIWSGLARPDPVGRAVSSAPVAGDSSQRVGNTGHADDSYSEHPAGTSDSSVAVYAGMDYVSTTGAPDSLYNPLELSSPPSVDCKISVAFSGSYGPGLPNGGGQFIYQGGQAYGVGFTVFGLVERDEKIGHIMAESNKSDPGGALDHRTVGVSLHSCQR